MGYSRSKKTIDRVRPVLELLAKNETGLIFPSKTALKLQYAIRDALAVIGGLPETAEDRKSFGHLKDKFKIRVKDGSVIFELKEIIQYDNPIEALASRRPSEISLPDVTSVVEVVGAIIKEKVDTMIFPNIILDVESADRLSAWCNKNNYYILKSLPLTIVKGNVEQDSTTPTIESVGSGNG